MLTVALSLAACHNVNPPSSEQSVGIIDVCNNSIGKSPDVFINGLKELGLEATLAHHERQALSILQMCCFVSRS
ncbi:MAG: hypothetical protein MJZ93_01830 [Paludibacteraceae bacterium]|nr:hypothetical protein [Paludibacteraceae bacterium]